MSKKELRSSESLAEAIHDNRMRLRSAHSIVLRMAREL